MEKVKAWFSVSDNRKTVYDILRFGVAPLLTATGVITQEQSAAILSAVASILLYGSATLASKNVEK